MRVIAQTRPDYDAWVKSQQAIKTAEGALELGVNNTTYQCASCHSFKAGVPGAVGPNLAHLADRTAFAGDMYLLNGGKKRDKCRGGPGRNILVRCP